MIVITLTEGISGKAMNDAVRPGLCSGSTLRSHPISCGSHVDDDGDKGDDDWGGEEAGGGDDDAGSSSARCLLPQALGFQDPSGAR